MQQPEPFQHLVTSRLKDPTCSWNFFFVKGSASKLHFGARLHVRLHGCTNKIWTVRQACQRMFNQKESCQSTMMPPKTGAEQVQDSGTIPQMGPSLGGPRRFPCSYVNKILEPPLEHRRSANPTTLCPLIADPKTQKR